MQIHKLFVFLLLSIIASISVAMDPGLDGSELPKLMSEGLATIRDAIVRHLEPQDLSNLDGVSRSLRHSVRQISPEVIDEIMTKQAILLSNILNAEHLKCHDSRLGCYDSRMGWLESRMRGLEYGGFKRFREYVLNEIRCFAHNNPGRWIRLHLQGNFLGDYFDDFRLLMQAIVREVQALNIDIASLYLDCNKIRELAPDIFAGLTHLSQLYLDCNKIRKLPDNIFAGLISSKRVNH